MAKKIYISYVLPGMILIASACSQEDMGRGENSESGERIEFNASLPEITTRATELKAASLNDIEVSAFTVGESSETEYFVNKTFSRNSTTEKFINYEPECIWPNNNDLLRFAAFAPSCDEMLAAGGDATSTGNSLTGFKVAQDIATQFDFVTAIATGKLLDNPENAITLKFQHQLSRIRLKAWGNSPSFDIEIAGVRLGGIATGGNFSFTAQADATDPTQAGVWESVTKGYVEYIFRDGDAIVSLDKTDGSPVSADKAVAILGSKVGGENDYGNSAMIVPSNNPAWRYKEDPDNGDNHADGMYFSVLVRVTDTTTPSDTKGSIAYPYGDAEYDEERIYLAVAKADGKTVKTRLYKRGDYYYTDAGYKTAYDLATNDAEIRAFGWAALPVAADLKPGHVYTYTLNYSYGVGLRDPDDTYSGDPVISDKVLVNVSVDPWKTASNSNMDEKVPRK